MPFSETDLKSTTPTRLVVAATFNAEMLAEPLAFLLGKTGLHTAVECAAYQQVFQQLSDRESRFAANRAGVNVLLVRPEDLVRFQSGAAAENAARVVTLSAELIAAIRAFSAVSPAPLLVAVCPPSPGFWSENASAAFASASFEMLRSEANLSFFNADALLGDQAAAAIADAHADAQGHIPYRAEFFRTLALHLARRIYALKMPPHKVIALDGDETLWKGVCGEVGPAAVELDEARRALQRFVKARKDEGFLLCLCSKNVEADVRETFALHTDWPLGLGDFTALRVNWQPKSEGLRELAAELSLGLDSFIFLDDSPLECAEIRTQLPGIAVLELPREPAQISGFLQAAWVFDRVSVTAEDQQRAAFYTQNREREETLKSAGSYADFLARLALSITVAPLRTDQWERAAQLSQRTNQFNLTLRRYQAGELRELAQNGQTEFRAVSVSDRFGDYGLVGLLAFRAEDRVLEIEAFLLSCRALGRGVEHEMMRHLLEIAHALGCEKVAVHFQAAPRNQPAHDFLRAVAHETTPSRFIVEQASSLIVQASSLPPGASNPSPTPLPGHGLEAGLTTDTPVDWTALATLFARPIALHAAFASELRARPDLAHAFIAPGTDLERRLAAIWATVLRIQPIGARDHFFELGGKSLQLVEVHRQLFDLGYRELPIAALFAHSTIASLAAHLTHQRSTRPAVQSGRHRGAQQRTAFARRR